MIKFLQLGAGLIVASLITVSPQVFSAEVAAEPKKEAVKPKEEAANAMAEGTKGVTEGVIARNEKGYLILTTTDGNLLFRPHWRGGMPKDGGGLDKKTLATLEKFKIGDSVRIAWTWSERRRIEEITTTKKAD